MPVHGTRRPRSAGAPQWQGLRRSTPAGHPQDRLRRRVPQGGIQGDGVALAMATAMSAAVSARATAAAAIAGSRAKAGTSVLLNSPQLQKSGAVRALALPPTKTLETASAPFPVHFPCVQPATDHSNKTEISSSIRRPVPLDALAKAAFCVKPTADDLYAPAPAVLAKTQCALSAELGAGLTRPGSAPAPRGRGSAHGRSPTIQSKRNVDDLQDKPSEVVSVATFDMNADTTDATECQTQGTARHQVPPTICSADSIVSPNRPLPPASQRLRVGRLLRPATAGAGMDNQGNGRLLRPATAGNDDVNAKDAQGGPSRETRPATAGNCAYNRASDAQGGRARGFVRNTDLCKLRLSRLRAKGSGPPLLAALPEHLLVQALGSASAADDLMAVAESCKSLHGVVLHAALQRLQNMHANLEEIETEDGGSTFEPKRRLHGKAEFVASSIHDRLQSSAPEDAFHQNSQPLRQLKLLEQMEAVLRPSMSVMRQPVVLARACIGGSTSPRRACWRAQAMVAGCNRSADDIGRVFSDRGRYAAGVEFQNPSPHYRVSCETLLLSPLSSLRDTRANIMSVVCGRDHLVLLDTDGHAWALGDPRAAGVAIPSQPQMRDQGAARPELLTQATPVAALWMVRLAKVACGNGHTAAIEAGSGVVYTWGRVLAKPHAETSGQELAWQLPEIHPAFASACVDIAAGDGHLAVACANGDMYAWGENHNGQCARDPIAEASGPHGPESANPQFQETPRPQFVPTPAKAGFGLERAVARRVACGRYHTVVLSSNGSVYTFGDGLSGQLGRNHASGEGWKPACVKLTSSSEEAPVLVAQVACGDDHTICLTDAGRLVAFGSGQHGQLCTGGVKNYRSPTLVRNRTGIREVVAGSNWTLLRYKSGKVFLAGTLAARQSNRRDDMGFDGSEEERGCCADEDNRLLRQLVAPIV
eukprot:TRINITY_DN77879_c0_g1_i1.p1 TRINITY_DN77879_c0_g1~~TRINITY_DN77879_c0_g1_i1.p1  ORF type:complete len:932 (+),score=102.78 TRINITY_DN77879_c0_g1_i1:70-2865(+)